MFVVKRKSEHQPNAESIEYCQTRGSSHLPGRQTPTLTATGVPGMLLWNWHGLWLTTHWSLRSTGVMWSRRRVPMFKHVVAFWTDCSFRNRVYRSGSGRVEYSVPWTYCRSFQEQSSQAIAWLLTEGILQVKWPNEQSHSTERWRWSSGSGFNPTRTTPPCYNNTTHNMQYKCMQTHLITVEWSQLDKTQSLTTCKNCSYKCIHLSTTAILNARD